MNRVLRVIAVLVLGSAVFFLLRPPPLPSENLTARKPEPARPAPAGRPAPPETAPPPSEDDSTLTLRDLARMYAVKDLAKIWPQSQPLARIGKVKDFINTQRAIRLSSADGKGTALRFSVVTDLDGGVIQPGSCASVARSGDPLQVGILGEGTLELRALPEKYAYLIEVRKTYVILILGEWSRARSDARKENPDIVYLYKRQTDGTIRYVGMFSANDETPMVDAVPEFCRREAKITP